MIVDKINAILIDLGSTQQLNRQCLSSDKNKRDALKTVVEEFGTRLFETTAREPCNFNNCETLNKIQTACSSATKTDQLKLLTLIPDSIPLIETIKQTKCGRKSVEKSKTLLNENISFSKIGLEKSTRTVDLATEASVINFFNSDQVSRMMPGKRDCKSVKVNGKRVLKQKRLLLSTIDELYQLYKETNPDIKIGFTKFYLLKPTECVSANKNGTHNVCVCKYHANAKLKAEIFKGGGRLFLRTSFHLTSFHRIDVANSV